MPKPSHREKLLVEGLRVVHEHGFARASVRDIVRAAGVPQGSFTNHFTSKEAFGVEVLDLYFARSRHVIQRTLLNDDRPPLARLNDYIDANKERMEREGIRNGCLFGNFSAEASDYSEVLRQHLAQIFAEVQASVGYCLKAAVAAKELPADMDCEATAGFIVGSLQGAILLAKTEGTAVPIERFQKILFSTILR